MSDLFDVTEADEAATSKRVALDNLRAQLAKRETMGVVDMYERAAWGAGATVAETEAVIREYGAIRFVACVSCGGLLAVEDARRRGWGTMLDEHGKRQPCCCRDCAAELYAPEYVAKHYREAGR
jgi:hypothetical protein